MISVGAASLQGTYSSSVSDHQGTLLCLKRYVYFRQLISKIVCPGFENVLGCEATYADFILVSFIACKEILRPQQTIAPVNYILRSM